MLTLKDLGSNFATDITRDTDITPWPLFKRSFEEIIQFRELFTVQVRNLSFNPYFIFAGIWGYKYPDVDAGTYTTREGLRRG